MRGAVGTARTQVGAKHQHIGNKGTDGVAGERNHGQTVPVEIQHVHALRSAGLLAHMSEPTKRNWQSQRRCHSDGIAHYLVFAVADPAGGDNNIRCESLILFPQMLNQKLRIIPDRDAPHHGAVLDQH